METIASPASIPPNASSSGQLQDQTHGQQSGTWLSGSSCGGCNQSLQSETGGVAVSFGDALWHVDCFRCAKCQGQVTLDRDITMQRDGRPVCESCSYYCDACQLPILGEAILTGDVSYHATCFTCRSCLQQIDDLVFARTSSGIYCMSCHNESVARSRRHEERERDKSRHCALISCDGDY